MYDQDVNRRRESLPRWAAAFLLLPSLLAGAEKQPKVLTGIDVLAESGFWEIQGKKVGLITNQTGIHRSGLSTAEILATAPGVDLVRIFSPEHGFTGVSEENRVSSATLTIPAGSTATAAHRASTRTFVQGEREIPIVSLYSGGIKGMRPKPEDLMGLDILLFDIQDIGARFYTYVATMGMALEESAKAGIPFIVLDRPNPINGMTLEGPILEDKTLREITPTAYFPIAVRHGMTPGEIALLHNEEIKHPSLTVIRLKGWTRKLWYDQTGLAWVAPSPNMPDLDAATLYPGVGCFETTNISVGRGTPLPFRWIGAPWMDSALLVKTLNKKKLKGVAFFEQEYTPTKSVFAGIPCRGIRMKILNRDILKPFAVFLHLAAALRDRHPEQIQWRWDETKRMVGTESFRKHYENKVSAEEMIRVFGRSTAEFERIRKPFLLY